MPWPWRPVGLAAGVRRVQFVPSHSQVSLKSAAGGEVPPNKTSLPPSAATAAPQRAGGLVTGARWVQFVPSHSQVSLNDPVTPVPPNRTSLLPSAAITAPLRAAGLAAGCLARPGGAVPLPRVAVHVIAEAPEQDDLAAQSGHHTALPPDQQRHLLPGHRRQRVTGRAGGGASPRQPTTAAHPRTPTATKRAHLMATLSVPIAWSARRRPCRSSCR